MEIDARNRLENKALFETTGRVGPDVDFLAVQSGLLIAPLVADTFGACDVTELRTSIGSSFA